MSTFNPPPPMRLDEWLSLHDEHTITSAYGEDEVTHAAVIGLRCLTCGVVFIMDEVRADPQEDG